MSPMPRYTLYAQINNQFDSRKRPDLFAALSLKDRMAYSAGWGTCRIKTEACRTSEQTEKAAKWQKTHMQDPSCPSSYGGCVNTVCPDASTTVRSCWHRSVSCGTALGPSSLVIVMSNVSTPVAFACQVYSGPPASHDHLIQAQPLKI